MGHKFGFIVLDWRVGVGPTLQIPWHWVPSLGVYFIVASNVTIRNNNARPVDNVMQYPVYPPYQATQHTLTEYCLVWMCGAWIEQKINVPCNKIIQKPPPETTKNHLGDP